MHEGLDGDHRLLRFGAPSVIRVHVRSADLAAWVDDVSRRHRQGPAVIAVIGWQIDLERAVDALQIGWQPERQSERGRDRIARVRKQTEGQGALRDERLAVLGTLRRDRDQRRPERLELWKCGLQSYQLSVAVRSPDPTEEGEHQRPAPQKSSRTHLDPGLVQK